MIYKIRFLFLPIVMISCIQFKMTDEEAREALSKNEVPIQFGNVMVDDRNMHYAFLDTKKDILIVFVHGSPGSWNAFIDFFKADTLLSNMDILSVDRAGFGASGYGIAEPSLEVQAYQLKIVTDQFTHTKKILIGHSLGGPVIARMAMDYPGAFHGLVFVAPSIDPEQEKDEWYRYAINTKVGGAITPKEFEVSNEEIMPLKEELTLMVPLWERITIPSIVIQGTADRLVPKENADFASKMLPDSLVELQILEDVNHFIPWNHPEEIIKAIQNISNGF